MSEPLLGHQVVSLKSRLKIILMDANRAPHEHMLGALCDLAIHSKQVGFLESLKAEEIVLKVARVVKLRVDTLVMLLHDVEHFLAEEGRGPAYFIDKSV